mgnify:FL=1|tara:strand:- start:812 stop:1324 length:513 start_codon:yes stop_codon:yes gene_type:complete
MESETVTEQEPEQVNETTDVTDAESIEDDTIQKPAKKKGRPPLTQKQKDALQLGREKSKKNMALAMTKAKLERLEAEDLKEAPQPVVKQEVAKKKPKKKVVIVVPSDSESSDSDEEVVYVSKKKKKKAKKRKKKVVIVDSDSDDESDSDVETLQEAQQVHHVFQPTLSFK